MKKVIIALTLALAIIAVAHPFVGGHKQEAATTMTTMSDPGAGGGTTT